MKNKLSSKSTPSRGKWRNDKLAHDYEMNVFAEKIASGDIND